MKKQQFGFGLTTAIIIIAIALGVGYGAKTYIVETQDIPEPTTNTEPNTDSTPSQPNDIPDDSTRSFPPDIPPYNQDTSDVSIEGLHASCKGGAQCSTGQECISYYGFAGPSGPSFATCEIRCSTDNDCPGTLQCGNFADGPGQVCSQF